MSEERVVFDIDPRTGRSAENKDDPNCDHCIERPWSVLLTFTGDWDRERKLCPDCSAEVLGWI